MKNIIKYISLVACVFTFASCQNNDVENFDNKAFVDDNSMVAETIIKGSTDVISKTIHLSTARPVEKDIKAQAVVAPNLLNTYNRSYYEEAVLLPDSYYKVDESNMEIKVGTTKSTVAKFSFMKLGTLDRSKTYVLPVEVKSEDISFLTSSKQYYFVFRAGALINVVADIEDNYLEIYPWKSSDRVKRMKQVTLEALIYPREFDKLISTVMGIEGLFLMRIGDAGVPDNQIQIATHAGNFTSPKLQLETNKWQHVALTYSQETKELKVYINGKVMAEGSITCIPHLVGNGSDRNFLVGKSYDDGRDLKGCISEARVWDVVRTPEEIAANIYTVDAKSPGLVAYWKFDDSSSMTVKDYTGNGNDLKANKKLTWKNVSLPAKN